MVGKCYGKNHLAYHVRNEVDPSGSSAFQECLMRNIMLLMSVNMTLVAYLSKQEMTVSLSLYLQTASLCIMQITLQSWFQGISLGRAS